MCGGDQNRWQGLKFASYHRKPVANMNPDCAYSKEQLKNSPYHLFIHEVVLQVDYQ